MKGGLGIWIRLVFSFLFIPFFGTYVYVKLLRSIDAAILDYGHIRPAYSASGFPFPTPGGTVTGSTPSDMTQKNYDRLLVMVREFREQFDLLINTWNG